MTANLGNIEETQWSQRGYHMPQTIFARIPLTIKNSLRKNIKK